RWEVEGRRLEVGPRGIRGALVLRTFSRPAHSIVFRLGRRFADTVEDLPVTVEPRHATAAHGLHEYRVTFDIRPTGAAEGEREGIIDPSLTVDLDGFELPARVLLFQKDFPRARLKDL